MEDQAKQRKKDISTFTDESSIIESKDISELASSDELSDNKSKEVNKFKSKLKNRPAWALMSEEADRISEEKQENEEKDLLEFVESLDFKKYARDVEVQCMIEKIKSRILSLEKDIRLDEERELETKKRQEMQQLNEVRKNLSLFCFD
jgi:hypothetical protein